MNSNNKTVLAVVGMPGSGKTVACDYLAKKGHPRIYFGQVTFDEMKKQGLEINEANEKKVREELRRQHGMATYAILNLPKIYKALETKDLIILESLYSWEEYQIVKKDFNDNFKVLLIHASPATRQQRLEKRPERPLTKEESLSRDQAQIENSHVAGPIAVADFVVVNEGTAEEMFGAVDNVIKCLMPNDECLVNA